MSGPWHALGIGALMAAVLTAGLSLPRPRAPGSQQDTRASVALALYGQDDPGAVVAAGFHGLGGASERISIRQLGRCRYELAAGTRRETIDFDRIATIRHTTVADPAAGLVRSIAHAVRGALPQLALAVLSGAEDAICDAQQCTGRRVFALSDPGRLEQARAAAADLQHDCRMAEPDSTSQPPLSELR